MLHESPDLSMALWAFNIVKSVGNKLDKSSHLTGIDIVAEVIAHTENIDATVLPIAFDYNQKRLFHFFS